MRGTVLLEHPVAPRDDREPRREVVAVGRQRVVERAPDRRAAPGPRPGPPRETVEHQVRLRRTEDARFIQGKGNYVDDLKLPGTLFGDFVRSPYGHARIKSINAEAALALPGVKAVLTAADLKPLNLHYMPTLAGDVQAVLAETAGTGQEI